MFTIQGIGSYGVRTNGRGLTRLVFTTQNQTSYTGSFYFSSMVVRFLYLL